MTRAARIVEMLAGPYKAARAREASPLLGARIFQFTSDALCAHLGPLHYYRALLAVHAIDITPKGWLYGAKRAFRIIMGERAAALRMI